jgi:anti-sigma regulatory factor (Ser/Thr protein kinase)
VAHTSSDGLSHVLAVYASAERAAETAIAYLAHGREPGETVVAHVSPRVRRCLAGTALDPVLAESEQLLGDVVGHPHQALWAVWQLAEEAARDGGRLRVIAEIDGAGHDPLDWARAETAANTALAGRPVRVLCLCDVRALDRLALDDIMSAHPSVWLDGPTANSEYVESRAHLRALDSRRAPDPLEAWPAKRQIRLAGPAELAAVRSEVQATLDAVGVADARREDFLEGVFQVCENAIVHGGDEAEVRLWATEGSVFCRVRDGGPGLADPLMGYLPPANGMSTPGTGLWAARQLCDHLTTTLEPEGFTVRMTVNA